MTTRDLETIRRSIRKKFYISKKINSYPFVSGDSFLHRAEYVIAHSSSNLNLFKTANTKYKSNFFVSANSSFLEELLLFLKKNESIDTQNFNLYIHNGDIKPNELVFSMLARRFRQIKVVNYMGVLENVFPIPIGLENMYKMRNGIQKDFQIKNKKSFMQREINLLICFKVNNNYEERTQAIKYSKKARGVKIITQEITPLQYRKLLLNSKFVLSPPGNGFDCHRTWESMYLGAIPLVKKEFWPFGNFDFPVRILKEWSEVEDIIGKSEFPEGIEERWRSVDFWMSDASSIH